MTMSPFNAVPNGDLISDPEITDLFDDAAQIHAILLFMAALAAAKSQAGLIPHARAIRIADMCRDVEAGFAVTMPATGETWVSVAVVTAALKSKLGNDDGRDLQMGASDQDVVDTALVLCLRDGIGILRRRIQKLARSLAGLADTHRYTMMAGDGTCDSDIPATFGLKVAGWLAPLVRLDSHIEILSRDFLRLSFGGAAGTLPLLGASMSDVARNLSEELDLPEPELPWQGQRNMMIEFASPLVALSGALGNIAQDLMILAARGDVEFQAKDQHQQPQNQAQTQPNGHAEPRAQAVVNLAQFNAAQLGMLARCYGVHHQDGNDFGVLSQIVVAVGRALLLSCDVMSTVKVDLDRKLDQPERIVQVDDYIGRVLGAAKRGFRE
ncbi:3-carboxy-cis,cis-muconate cycloisomerase [Thalassospira sp. MA62]|nr:3-carboxy-cis,cis-muconate cycloisomerase [Thalassospira sp. MA62]